MDNIVTSTDVSDISAIVIARVFQQQLIQDAELLGTVADVSALARPGAKSIDLPRMGGFVVNKKQPGEQVALQKLSVANDRLELNEHAVIQGLIEDIADLQAEAPYVAEYVRRMAPAHALQVDLDIFAQIKLVGNTNAYASGSAPTKADFTTANKVFRVNKAKSRRRFCLVSPTREKNIMDLADFVDADRWIDGSSQAKLEAMFPGGVPGTGFIGRAYGWNILSTTVVPENDNGMYFYDDSHVAFGFQMAPRFQSQYSIRDLGNVVSMDQLYGQKVLDSGTRGLRIGA